MAFSETFQPLQQLWSLTRACYSNERVCSLFDLIAVVIVVLFRVYRACSRVAARTRRLVKFGILTQELGRQPTLIQEGSAGRGNFDLLFRVFLHKLQEPVGYPHAPSTSPVKERARISSAGGVRCCYPFPDVRISTASAFLSCCQGDQTMACGRARRRAAQQSNNRDIAQPNLNFSDAMQTALRSLRRAAPFAGARARDRLRLTSAVNWLHLKRRHPCHF